MQHWRSILFPFLFAVTGILAVPHSIWAAGQEVDFLSDDFYAEEVDEPDISDPLEPLNRAVFMFNDKAYFWVLKPVASAYDAVMPWDIRNTVSQFFSNLESPVRLVNCLLQGRFHDAGRVMMRFLLNSTVGVLGLDDFARREAGFEPVHATLGETMYSWGIGDGCYLVIPLMGPTTVRDLGGSLVDGLALTPYYIYIDPWETRAGVYAGKELNTLSMHLGEYEDLKKLSFDPYVAIRNGYFQHRQKLYQHDELECDDDTPETNN